MAHPSTLYRFQIELSDIDRGVYESLDFRVAMHPSETHAFLLSRVLAMALNTRPGLEFAPGGLSDPDAPALAAPDLAIEIGNPSARRLHKLSKAAAAVRVYTYKDPTALKAELESGDIYGAERIEAFSFSPPRFLEGLAGRLDRSNRWTLVHSDGALTVTIGEEALEGEVRRV